MATFFYAGYIRDDVDFDPGPDTNYVKHTSEDADLFLVKYSDLQNDSPVNKLFAENLVMPAINRNEKLNVGRRR